MKNSEPELRQRYLSTLERLETGEARWAKLENVLRLTIGRLCLAARGRSGRLDTELRSLSEVLRRQPSAEDIESCLEPLSRAVAALDQAPDQPAQASREPARTMPRSARETRGGEPQAQETQPQAQETQPQAQEARPRAPEIQPAEAAASAPADDRDARAQIAIVAMLERLAVLPELRPALHELQEHSFSQLTAEELSESFEKVARSIGEQRSKLQREKLEIEDLLRQIDARLEELSGYLTGEATEQKSAQDSTQQLNLLVLDEMHELNTDVQRAIDLAQLRLRVRVRLETITTHLQDFRALEEQRFAGQIDRTGRLRVRIAELESESRSLQRSLREEQRLAMIDSLTGIANRAAYDERIQHEFLSWSRDGGPISILTWDIDHFKEVNDSYGHRAGDKVLRIIGQHLAQHVRGTDFVARYGGDEMVMILVGTATDQALATADKIRNSIARIGFHFRNRPVTVTASCGITILRPDDTPDTLFDRADQALYRAKDGGRNRCVIL